jgi:hypothetical protein
MALIIEGKDNFSKGENKWQEKTTILAYDEKYHLNADFEWSPRIDRKIPEVPGWRSYRLIQLGKPVLAR